MDTPLLIIELDAFNDDLLQQAAQTEDLPYLLEILNFKRAIYKTNDRYNSGHLAPWVQWASMHTGKPAKTHQVRFPAETAKLPYIDHVLTQAGKTVATYGCVMPMTTQSARQWPSFWYQNEKADFLYQQLKSALHDSLAQSDKPKKLRALAKLWYPHWRLKRALGAALVQHVQAEFKSQLATFGWQPFVLMGYFEQLMMLQMMADMRAEKAAVYFLNLGTLSYMQQHHWQAGETIAPEMLAYLKQLDDTLGRIREEWPHLSIIMHNGLSQMNEQREAKIHAYQAIAPTKLLIALGARFLKAEAYGEWVQVDCVCEQHQAETYQRLKAVKIAGKPFFQVFKSDISPYQVGFKVQYTNKIADDDVLHAGEETLACQQYIAPGRVVTGRYIPMGTVYSNHIEFPDHIPNHDFNRYMLSHLLPDQFERPKRQREFNFKFEIPEQIAL